MRANSASLAGVANWAAAATWSSVRLPVLRAWSSAGSWRSASPVRVMRTAVRWSLLEICASHCALEEHPAACQSPSSSASRTICVTRCLMRASCTQSERNSQRRASRRRSRAWSTAPSSVANIRSILPAPSPDECAETVPKCSAFRDLPESPPDLADDVVGLRRDLWHECLPDIRLVPEIDRARVGERLPLVLR